jgi:hypothetical protein
LERQVLRGARILILAVGARKVLAAHAACLSKQNLVNVEDAGDGVRELLDIVVVGNAEGALFPVVLETQPQE